MEQFLQPWQVAVVKQGREKEDGYPALPWSRKLPLLGRALPAAPPPPQAATCPSSSPSSPSASSPSPYVPPCSTTTPSMSTPPSSSCSPSAAWPAPPTDTTGPSVPPPGVRASASSPSPCDPWWPSLVSSAGPRPPCALTSPHSGDRRQPEVQFQLFWLVTHVVTCTALSIAVIHCPSALPGVWIAESSSVWIAESEPPVRHPRHGSRRPRPLLPPDPPNHELQDDSGA